MLKSLMKGLFGRLLGYGGLVLGFWWLREAFLEINYPVGVMGGLTILTAMYMVVGGRRHTNNSDNTERPDFEFSNTEEDDPSDSLDGRDESNQLPP
ncbi:MAG: hypothetical protein NZ762_08095 [Dehalococcoidia bacterium]|nr:hypothetical protein [Dehalococcoidia bacterium]